MKDIGLNENWNELKQLRPWLYNAVETSGSGLLFCAALYDRVYMN